MALQWKTLPGVARRRVALAPVVAAILVATLPSAGPTVAGQAPSLRRQLPIPAATFTLGPDPDNGRTRGATIAPFELDRTEVTVAEYAACVRTGACTRAGTERGCNAGDAARSEHPINCVDWHQATAFCEWTGKRLPTEDEWEYAARGPDGRDYPWGAENPSEGTEARGCFMLGTIFRDETCPVGQYPTFGSAFGAVDMAGNVAEWTSSEASVAANKTAGSMRVFRGGSYKDSPLHLLTRSRRKRAPTAQYPDLGFRCALSPGGRPAPARATAGAPKLTASGTPAHDELRSRYERIWKAVLLEANRATPAQFSAHVTVDSTNLVAWNDGVSFEATYTFRIGWAQARALDSFLVKWDSSSILGQDTPVPLDTYLDERQVRLLIARDVGNPRITRAPFGASLKHATQASAEAALAARAPGPIANAKVDLPGMAPPRLLLEAYVDLGTVAMARNQCMAARLDLVTGAATFQRGPCAVH